MPWHRTLISSFISISFSKLGQVQIWAVLSNYQYPSGQLLVMRQAFFSSGCTQATRIHSQLDIWEVFSKHSGCSIFASKAELIFSPVTSQLSFCVNAFKYSAKGRIWVAGSLSGRDVVEAVKTCCECGCHTPAGQNALWMARQAIDIQDPGTPRMWLGQCGLIHCFLFYKRTLRTQSVQFPLRYCRLWWKGKQDWHHHKL